MKRTTTIIGSCCTVIFFATYAISCYSQPPEWSWAKSAGGTFSDRFLSVSVDGSGNIIAAGSFNSPTISFDTIAITNQGCENMVVVKYDPGGHVIWARSAGGSKYDRATSVTTDASGNIIVAGYFTSASITFGSYTLSNFWPDFMNIFVVKYDGNGNVVWAKSVGEEGDDAANSVATDNNGNIYVAGYFRSNFLSIGPYSIYNLGFNDILILKYDSNGNITWAEGAGGDAFDEALSVCADENGSIYMAGSFESISINFDAYYLYNADVSNADMFVVKFDNGNNPVWAASAGGSAGDAAVSVDADADGNAYVTGNYYSSGIIFGSNYLTNAGYSDIFVVKYFGINGSVLWARSAGGSNSDMARSLKVSPYGNIYLTGTFNSPFITFGSCTLTGNSDLFLVKYDDSGNAGWARSAAGDAEDDPYSIACGSNGSIYLAGYFYSTNLSFDSVIIANANMGTEDVFLAAMATTDGTEISESSEFLTVFPNPSNGNFTIDLPSQNVSEFTVDIYNILGIRVFSKSCSSVNQYPLQGTCRININVKGIPPGIYSVIIDSDNHSFVKKVVID